MPLFAAVSLEDLEAVADQFASEYYAANETIFAQGDSGDRLYILVRGQVAVLATDAQGREQQVETEDGDHFGKCTLHERPPRDHQNADAVRGHQPQPPPLQSPGGAVPGHAAGH
jgi:ATP-binding cassette subfamily B protein